MTQTSRHSCEQPITKLMLAVEAGGRSHRYLAVPLHSLSTLAVTLLFLAGSTFPVMAQTKPMARQKDTMAVMGQSTVSAQRDLVLEAEIEQIVQQMIEAEIQHWSPAEKSALKTMDSLGLKAGKIAELTTLSAADLHAKMKTDKKLAQLNAAGISSEEALKLAPTLLLSRYLLNIGRAAVWGGVVTAIRAADFDYSALSSALASGNTRQFMSLIGEGLAGETSFLDLMSSAATFACGSATLDFTPGVCNRFASGVQKIFTRVESSGTRRQAQSASNPVEAGQPESRQTESIRSRFFRRLRPSAQSKAVPVRE